MIQAEIFEKQRRHQAVADRADIWIDYGYHPGGLTRVLLHPDDKGSLGETYRGLPVEYLSDNKIYKGGRQK